MILVDDDDMEVREEQPSSHRLAKSMGVDARNMQVMKASFFMEEEAPSGLGMFLNCRVRLRQKKKVWFIWAIKPVYRVSGLAQRL